MGTFLLLLLGIIVYIIYLIIEFAIPVILVYLILSHPHNTTIWYWAILLLVWFIARMTVYIIKEVKKK